MPAAQQEATTGAADDVDPGTACCSTVDDETLPELNPLSDHSYSVHNKSETELLRKISSLKDVIGSLEEEVKKVQAQVISLKRQLEKSRQEQVDSMKLCDRVKQKNRSLKLDLSATYRRMKEAEAKGKTEFRYEAIKQDHKKLSPNGFVTFVSDLAPGRLSDKALTKACGVLDKFTPGRSVMADRGFTISEECKQRSLHLNIPPFMEGRPQLSEEDEQETRHIASVRIHVERVIRRVKNFRILSQIFPNSMSEQLNKVWHVCALLTNFVDEPLL
ncbi:uncharacterized protein ISCGN_032608 [Ixodes scapularis]